MILKTHENTNAWLFAINDDLFNKIKIIITKLEQEGNCVIVRLASVCGVGFIEEEGNIVFNKDYFDYIRSIVTDRSKYYLDNINFGNFTKADLFKSINERIAVPIQNNWNHAFSFIYNNNYSIKEIELESVPIFFTHIKHGLGQNNHFYIEEIRGEIPSADEMILCKWSIKAFENPQDFTLEKMTNLIWEVVQETNPADDYQIENDIKPLPFSVNSPGSLLKMLSYFGIPEWGGAYFDP